jgi:phospholipase C
MDTRRSFIKKASFLSGSAGLLQILPGSIKAAMDIDPAPGTTYLDAEHVVFLMQENRSFDHTYGSLQGVRGFNDPRAIFLPDKNLVWLQSDKNGDTYAPFRLNIKDTNATWMSSLPHSWSNQVDARNDGKYDKWLETKHSGNKEYRGMPLTMGFHTREDIPFYYALADAFTVCDQNFCSSLTGTTPNRLYFWTGTIREKPDEKAIANVWNEDADLETMVSWTSFPERLEANDISWKVYQNEVAADTGFQGEEEGWLSNFGDNPLEYMKQYHVKLSEGYIHNLPIAAGRLSKALKEKMESLAVAGTNNESAEKLTREIDWIKKAIGRNEEEQKIYTLEKYNQLSPVEKSIHEKAFSTNKKDPHYRELDKLTYTDGATQRELKLPKGDILHQFREDVNSGTLPTVSWIVAPENFSDHPSAAWYGAWYISEVMDILTKNPEVWKKTIFILTYDENDGYFDHVPPFTAPDPNRKDSGKVSKGIDTAVEFVASKEQQSNAEDSRISPIGLGYRVPMVIASPWTRGGFVNSQVFDHTSSLQFLEKFLTHKTGKKIEEPNISEWRRTVCGDLTSAFRTWNGENIPAPASVERDEFLESIHSAQFKNLPSNYKKLSAAEIEKINVYPYDAAELPSQEKGTRSASPLPYELFVNGQLSADKKSFEINFKAGNETWGKRSAGAPFNVYAPGVFLNESVKTWSYAVSPGDTLKDSWSLKDFKNDQYHLRVYGPNGFYREFMGNEKDPQLDLLINYERGKGKSNKELTGNIVLSILNKENKPVTVEIIDNSYKTGNKSLSLASSANGKASGTIQLNLEKNHAWYDFSIRIKGFPLFEKRYAGRVETGHPGKTDPLMGRELMSQTADRL